MHDKKKDQECSIDHPECCQHNLEQPKDQDVKELTPEELDKEKVAELPDREAMSLINANLAAPVNAAVAANVLSDNSIAYANAEQTVDITQDN